MATVIRFSRHGTKKRPYYRIVVQDKTAPRDGKFIEHIGAFDPLKTSLNVERARLEYWLSVGAKMSDTVASTVKPLMKTWGTTAAGIEAAPAPKKAAAKKTAAKKPSAEA